MSTKPPNLPNPINAELMSLNLAVRRLVRAQEAYSWRGAGYPADIIPIEQELSNAEANYRYRLGKVNDLLIKKDAA